MKNILSPLIYISICLIIFLAYKCYKHYINEKIRNRISCWLIEDTASLLDYIQIKCIGKAIEDQYLITAETERNAAYEIIGAYQGDMKNKYLKGRYTVNLKYARMTYAEYFMCYFASYLCQNNQYYFADNKMYNEISRKYYGDNYSEIDNPSYDTYCTLTDYGRAYNKLYYMVVLFCEKSVYLNKNHDYCSKGRKKVLDTNEAMFCNYLD